MQLERIANYWNLCAEGFSMSNIEQLTTNQRYLWLNRMKECAPAKEKLTCLDIGCGPGFLAILLAGCGHNVYAVDYTEKMLEYAIKNARTEGVSIQFQAMDAQSLSFPDNSFDFIVSRNVTWNLDAPQKAYAEWCRVLKPGGRLLNFDGNHKLNCSNKLYQEYIESDAYVDPHKKEHIRGAGLNVMEEIARHLPLSYVERPVWDMHFLIEAGCVAQISVEINRVEFFSPSLNKNTTIIKDFSICAQK